MGVSGRCYALFQEGADDVVRLQTVISQSASEVLSALQTYSSDAADMRVRTQKRPGVQVRWDGLFFRIIPFFVLQFMLVFCELAVGLLNDSNVARFVQAPHIFGQLVLSILS
jgi:hypothetical protein